MVPGIVFLGCALILIGLFIGLETSNGLGSLRVVSQHSSLESSEISCPKSKDLGLIGLGNGRYGSSYFWSWVDIHLRNF